MSLTSVEETGERRRKLRFYNEIEKVTTKEEKTRHYYYESEYDDIEEATTEDERTYHHYEYESEHDEKENVKTKKKGIRYHDYESECNDIKEVITDGEVTYHHYDNESEQDKIVKFTTEEEGILIRAKAMDDAENYQTEIPQLKNKAINNNEIFLVELITNSNDALESTRNKDSTYRSKMCLHKDLEIRIELDKKNSTLTIIDTGIGMTKDDLQKLHSIIQYTTGEVEEVLQSCDNKSMFSLCFYSAYLIADKVVVQTKYNDEHDNTKGYIFIPKSGEPPDITDVDTDQSLFRGTKITLHINKSQSEYLEIKRIEEVVKKHFQSCRYPIKLLEGDVIKDILWEEYDHADQKDIHKVPCLSEEISVYSTFHGNKIRTANGGEMIKTGLRVLPLKPNGRLYEMAKGGLGTIYKIKTNGALKVLWDLTKEITEFKKGPNGQYDLLLFDNAQIEVKHTRVECDGCSEYPLKGIRWKCLDCEKYDLCTKCYMNGEQHIYHSFMRIQSERANGVKIDARFSSKSIEAAGMEKDVKVKLRKNRTKVEHIDVRCSVCGTCPLRGVRWKCSTCEGYNLCTKCYLSYDVDHSFKRIKIGKANKVNMNDIDFTIITEAQGNDKNGKIQLRNDDDHTDVRCIECKEWLLRGFKWESSESEDNYLCTKCCLAKKPKNDHSFKRIESERANEFKRKEHAKTKTKTLTETSEAQGNKKGLQNDVDRTEVKHPHVRCKECKENPLRGTRWKCLVCKDYDLCTKCYLDDAHFDIGHSLEEIENERVDNVKTNAKKVPTTSKEQGNEKNFKEQQAKNVDRTGTVTKLIKRENNTFRSDAKVKWNDMEIRYPVGRDGRCDLKFIEKAEGPSYYKDHLPIVSSGTASTGARVVRGKEWKIVDNDGGGHGIVGTIVNIHEGESTCTLQLSKKDKQTESDVKSKISLEASTSKTSVLTPAEDKKKDSDLKTEKHVHVQWDNGDVRCYVLKDLVDLLRILDNGPSGVEHAGYYCDSCYPPENKSELIKCIKGIRWKCSICHDLDLCTDCYMKDKHVKAHSFQRVLRPNNREPLTVSQCCRKNSIKYESFGIFEEAKVVKLDTQNKGKIGTVTEICDCVMDTGFIEIEVKWSETDTRRHDILELICTERKIYSDIYWDHLPTLGKVPRAFFEVDFVIDGRHSKKKINVNIWRNIDQHKKKTYKPSLYIIFAEHSELDRGDENQQKDEKTERLVDEVIEFAKKTQLPCHIAGKQIMFYGGSSTSVFIHCDTKEDVIKVLVKKGFKQFERGEVKDKVDEIEYFKRMAESVLGENVLPVIISLRKGGLKGCVMRSAAKLKIPIIRLKKHTYTVTVLTPVKLTNREQSLEMKEHNSDVKDPWNFKKPKDKTYDIGRYDKEDDPYEIALPSEVHIEFKDNLDGLICYLIIGVSMKCSLKDNIYGDDTGMYSNALSMYLLKQGKWKIPKEHINQSFNQHSIEYIYEKDLAPDFKKGLWSDLELSTDMAYQRPSFIQDEDRLDVSKSELFGLILFALLQKQYWDGAKQLIETGFIQIRHILIGCVILDTIASNWRTAPLLQEKLRSLNKVFTKRAIRILSCIYEADKKVENDKEISEQNEDEWGEAEHINHAGRLLLNHRYIEDTIKTQNKTFLDNPEVKNIINKMWYGCEQLNSKTIVSFIALACCHIIILPILMISLESRPLRLLYNKYKLPFVKVFINMLGFLSLLLAYAYMLLFDYNEDGISNTDIFIITWMVSLFLDEIKQHIVAMVRKKWKNYANDWWNRLDWISMTVYFLGMVFRFGETTYFRYASKILLVLAFMMLCIRILNLFCMSEILGPKLVMIRKMFSDTFAFMIIMTVIMMCYNISLYALLYPNSELSWSQMEKITQNGYWMLFGELNLDGDTLSEPDCTFNRTIYQAGMLQRCPEQLGLYIVPYLKAIYGLIAVIMLLNLLIAMYSDTFQQVHKVSEFYWSQLQTNFLEEYSVKTIFPIHLQLFALPIFLVHAFIWICMQKLSDDDDDYLDRDKPQFNSSPMFVRVFLYDTNFDLMLPETDEAEKNGALMAKGEIDIAESDRITILQRKLDSNCTKIDQLKEKNDRQNQKVLNRQKDMDKNLKELKKLILDKLDIMTERITKINTTSEEFAEMIKEAIEEDKSEPDETSSDEDENDSDKSITSSDSEYR